MDLELNVESTSGSRFLRLASCVYHARNHYMAVVVVGMRYILFDDQRRTRLTGPVSDLADPAKRCWYGGVPAQLAVAMYTRAHTDQGFDPRYVAVNWFPPDSAVPSNGILPATTALGKAFSRDMVAYARLVHGGNYQQTQFNWPPAVSCGNSPFFIVHEQDNRQERHTGIFIGKQPLVAVSLSPASSTAGECDVSPPVAPPRPVVLPPDGSVLDLPPPPDSPSNPGGLEIDVGSRKHDHGAELDDSNLDCEQRPATSDAGINLDDKLQQIAKPSFPVATFTNKISTKPLLLADIEQELNVQVTSNQKDSIYFACAYCTECSFALRAVLSVEVGPRGESLYDIFTKEQHKEFTHCQRDPAKRKCGLAPMVKRTVYELFESLGDTHSNRVYIDAVDRWFERTDTSATWPEFASIHQIRGPRVTADDIADSKIVNCLKTLRRKANPIEKRALQSEEAILEFLLAYARKVFPDMDSVFVVQTREDEDSFRLNPATRRYTLTTLRAALASEQYAVRFADFTFKLMDTGYPVLSQAALNGLRETVLLALTVTFAPGERTDSATFGFTDLRRAARECGWDGETSALQVVITDNSAALQSAVTNFFGVTWASCWPHVARAMSNRLPTYTKELKINSREHGRVMHVLHAIHLLPNMSQVHAALKLFEWFVLFLFLKHASANGTSMSRECEQAGGSMYEFMFGKNGGGGFLAQYGSGAWCQAQVGAFARCNTSGLERMHALIKAQTKHTLKAVGAAHANYVVVFTHPRWRRSWRRLQTPWRRY